MDSAFNLEDYVRSSFRQAIDVAEDTAFVGGTGHATNQPGATSRTEFSHLNDPQLQRRYGRLRLRAYEHGGLSARPTSERTSAR